MENILTEIGYQKFKEELIYLKKIKRREIAERIREAQGFGDIDENSELDAAKDEQAFLEGKILKLEYLIKNVKIIRNSSTERIEAGCRVVLINSQKRVEYILVGSAETDPTNGKISIDSPLGQALNGKSKGEKISLDTISGPIEYKIEEIRSG